VRKPLDKLKKRCIIRTLRLGEETLADENPVLIKEDVLKRRTLKTRKKLRNGLDNAERRGKIEAQPIKRRELQGGGCSLEGLLENEARSSEF
jgi:hypothetical protein